MMLSQIKRVATALLLSTVVTGCAGTVFKPTAEQNRDTTGAYDGKWTVEIQKANSLQQYGKWTMNCGDMRRAFDLYVVNGALELRRGKSSKTAYVSDSGRFKAILPIDNKSRASGISGSTMGNGNMQIILRGQLGDEKSVGYITYGVAELGYAGCTAKTQFKKLT